MGERDFADLANVLLTAAGAGLALACAYLVMKPAARTFRKWAGAALVAVPGLLLGLLLAQHQVGVRAAYGDLTQALLGSSASVDEDFGVPQPEAGGRTQSATGGVSGVIGVAPDATAGPVYTGSPDSVEEQPVTIPSGDDPQTPAPTPPTTTSPPVTTETPTPPTPSETPSETETTPPPPPPPSETETTPPPPPPPSETTPPPPPPPSETPPPPTTEPPPPPPPEPSPT